MGRRIFRIKDDLVVVTTESLVGQINTEVIDNQIPVLLEKLHKTIDRFHKANLDHLEFQFDSLSNELLLGATKLKFMSEQRLEQIAEDKVRYAPHPTFIP